MRFSTDGPGPRVPAAIVVVLLVLSGIVTAATPAFASASGEAEGDQSGVWFEVEMAPLITPIFYDNKVRGQALIEVRFAVKGLESHRATLDRMPRVRDALMQRLYRFSASGYWRDDRLDLDRLKKDFQARTDLILGKDVAEIYIFQARLFDKR